MAETKLHTIKCKHSNAQFFWTSNIDRKTENNNTLIKCSPAFNMACQSKNATLTSDRAFKLFICEKLGIAFDEAFMYYASEKPEAKALATEQAKAMALADTSGFSRILTPKESVIVEKIKTWLKAGGVVTAESLALLMATHTLDETTALKFIAEAEKSEATNPFL